eukprot:GEMP01001970.1.p1 GENE.GEMP01001970.1~~GEMP01001970.1.p1  ORF type:complete len:1630 (+),score=435.81 GEMP01001970.1:70-4959(+)
MNITLQCKLQNNEMANWLDSKIPPKDFVTRQESPGPHRTATPLLAYVDRARFPTLGPTQVRRTRSMSPGCPKAMLSPTHPDPSDWEHELQRWKKKYGADEPAPATLMTMGDARPVRQSAFSSQTADTSVLRRADPAYKSDDGHHDTSDRPFTEVRFRGPHVDEMDFQRNASTSCFTAPRNADADQVVTQDENCVPQDMADLRVKTKPIGDDGAPAKSCLENKDGLFGTEKTRVRDPGKSADVSTRLYYELRRVSIKQMNEADVKTVQLVLSMSQKGALLQLLADGNLTDDERLGAIRQKLEDAGTPPTPITPLDSDAKLTKSMSPSNKLRMSNLSACLVEVPSNSAVGSQTSSEAGIPVPVEAEHTRKSLLIIPHDFSNSEDLQCPEETPCNPLDPDRASTPLLACVDRARFRNLPPQFGHARSLSPMSPKTPPMKRLDPYDWEDELLRWKQKYGVDALSPAASPIQIGYPRPLREGGLSNAAEGRSLVAAPIRQADATPTPGDGQDDTIHLSYALSAPSPAGGECDKRLNRVVQCLEPHNTMHSIDTEEEEFIVTEGNKRTAENMAEVQQKMKTLAGDMDGEGDDTPLVGAEPADTAHAPDLLIPSQACTEEEIEHQKTCNEYWLKAPHNTMQSIDGDEHEIMVVDSNIRGARDIAEVQAKMVALVGETSGEPEDICVKEKDDIAEADKKTAHEPGPTATVVDVGTRLYYELRRVSRAQIMEADMGTAQLALSKSQQDALRKLLSGGNVTDKGNLDAIRQKLEGGGSPLTPDSTEEPSAPRPSPKQLGINRLMPLSLEVPSNTAVGSRQLSSSSEGSGVPSEVEHIGTSQLLFSGFRDTQTELNAWMEQYDTRGSPHEAVENEDQKHHIQSFENEGLVPKWPLHYAAMIGDVQGIHRLCVEGHDPNGKMLDRFDSEPLTCAAAHGQLASVVVLCQCGADPQRPADKANHTPLTKAEEKEHHHVATFLREYAQRVRAGQKWEKEPATEDVEDLVCRMPQGKNEEAPVVHRGGGGGKKFVDLSTLGEREAEGALQAQCLACPAELQEPDESVRVEISENSLEKMQDVNDVLDMTSMDLLVFVDEVIRAPDDSGNNIGINNNKTIDINKNENINNNIDDDNIDHGHASNNTNIVICSRANIPSVSCHAPSQSLATRTADAGTMPPVSHASPSSAICAPNVTTTMVRDFLHDILRQRLKDKHAAQNATPWVDAACDHNDHNTAVESTAWRHLAARARSVAPYFTRVAYIITTMKCFASMRHPDTELYMLLLGEISPLIPACTPVELINLLRLLARLRLRETTYVEMLCVALMEKTTKKDNTGGRQEPPTTFIIIPRRAIIKCANAISALDVRGTMPRFVTYFLQYITARLDMFDAALMGLWSPLFIVHYCTNAARIAMLERMAHVDAGFSSGTALDSPFDDEEEENWDHGRALCNVALTVTVLRKEQHAFVSLLDPHVRHYFDKIERACENDALAGVTLLSSSSMRKQELSALSRHVSSAAPAQSDWFSSALHRDVSACLTYLGILHSNGVIRGRYVCDIVATNMSNMRGSVIYECNSPECFNLGTFTYTAARRMRHSVMHKMATSGGPAAEECRVQFVDYFEWDALSRAQKLVFLLGIHGSAPNGHACKNI